MSSVLSEDTDGFATSDGSFLALYVHDPRKVVGSILARGYMFGDFSLAQYYQDQIGSTRMIRFHNNTLANLYEYDPYGNALTTYGSESFNYYRFTGAELDKDSSNFYYFPYRYYAPGLQRWMIRDPAAMVDGPNLYAYVRNSPVDRADPVGLFWPGQGQDNIQMQWHYGNWCGAGWSGGGWYSSWEKDKINWDKPAKDAVDKCCKIHDNQMQYQWGGTLSGLIGIGLSGLIQIQQELFDCLWEINFTCLSPEADKARDHILDLLDNIPGVGPQPPAWDPFFDPDAIDFEDIVGMPAPW